MNGLILGLQLLFLILGSISSVSETKLDLIKDGDKHDLWKDQHYNKRIRETSHANGSVNVESGDGDSEMESSTCL